MFFYRLFSSRWTPASKLAFALSFLRERDARCNPEYISILRKHFEKN